jgi:hypothetical protein
MAEPVSAHQKQHGEVEQTCDGCVQFHPSSELVPVGDGSIKVCEGCYAQAILVVVTAADILCPSKSTMNSPVPWSKMMLRNYHPNVREYGLELDTDNGAVKARRRGFAYTASKTQ